ncbi:YqzL family protein [Bacillus carboniphilus]|uniref:YqzL family protein n=1 Tax=Bacillus carboniphilus TaxID=86663 RepID=A0ABY9JZW5_9BACI|nr:YqzL family protein [Bacillus carboniphilus]WLR43980.1 YqzL family protein [Bacillus carboniphilus]
MLSFTWKVFTETGNIDMYLLFKELEKEKYNKYKNKLDENQKLAKVDF